MCVVVIGACVCEHLNWDLTTHTVYGPVITSCNYSKNTVYPNFLMAHLLIWVEGCRREWHEKQHRAKGWMKCSIACELNSKSASGTSVEFFAELATFLSASVNLIPVHWAESPVYLLSTSVQQPCVLYYLRFCKFWVQSFTEIMWTNIH